MPARADLSIYQGDDYGAEVSIFNADGTPTDLTGAVAKAQIRADVADRAPAIVMEITTVVEDSKVILSLPKTDTEKLTRSAYVWDLQLVFPENSVVTVLAGKVTVALEVTRA